MISYDLSAFVITDVHPRVASYFLCQEKNTGTTISCAIYICLSFTYLIPFSCLKVWKVQVSAWLQMSFLGAALYLAASSHSQRKPFTWLMDVKKDKRLEGESLFCCGGRSYGQWCYVTTPGLPVWLGRWCWGWWRWTGEWLAGEVCSWVNWQLACPWACHCWIWARVAAVAPWPLSPGAPWPPARAAGRLGAARGQPLRAAASSGGPRSGKHMAGNRWSHSSVRTELIPGPFGA